MPNDLTVSHKILSKPDPVDDPTQNPGRYRQSKRLTTLPTEQHGLRKLLQTIIEPSTSGPALDSMVPTIVYHYLMYVRSLEIFSVDDVDVFSWSSTNAAELRSALVQHSEEIEQLTAMLNLLSE